MASRTRLESGYLYDILTTSYHGRGIPAMLVSMPDYGHSPEGFPRRMLLALGGMSPQVVTETLYYLCIRQSPAFIPTEVRLITTSVGRDEAIDGLLDHDGEFHEFLKDYALKGKIVFTTEHLHPIVDQNNTPLEDVRTESDNITAADMITEYIRQLTSDPECAVHVSISGGRNTLGFYLGYALSMFGRPQDRLSHVLVQSEFQGNDQFFYPPPTPEVIRGRNGTSLNTAHAEVTLAEIPFVSLRHGLPKSLLEGKATYSQTVSAIRRALAPPKLEIDISARKIWAGDVLIEMPPQLFAWYAWMAQRRQTVEEFGGHVSWRDDGIAEEFLAVYKRVVGPMAHDYEVAAATLAQGMTKEFFDEKKSRVNRWLEDTLGKIGMLPYAIVASGKRPRTRFGLLIQMK
jgi:CRISPR-associated protein (TIGR02584 family)